MYVHAMVMSLQTTASHPKHEIARNEFQGLGARGALRRRAGSAAAADGRACLPHWHGHPAEVRSRLGAH